MPRKKITIKLPDWFDLAKYDGVRNLDIEGWYVQIHRRLHFFKGLISDPIQEKKLEDDYRLRLKEVRENPLGSDPRYKPTPPENCWNSGAVGLASPWNLWRLLPDPLLDTDNSHSFSREKIVDAFVKKEKWVSDPIEDPSLFHRCFPLLSINLGAPDEILKASFASLLTQLRTRKPWKAFKPFDVKIEIRNWCDFAVLPYWDLQTWAEETKTPITQSKMAEWIFPPDEFGKRDLNTIRNTTKPKAEKIFSENFLDILGAFLVEKR